MFRYYWFMLCYTYITGLPSGIVTLWWQATQHTKVEVRLYLWCFSFLIETLLVKIWTLPRVLTFSAKNFFCDVFMIFGVVMNVKKGLLIVHFQEIHSLKYYSTTVSNAKGNCLLCTIRCWCFIRINPHEIQLDYIRFYSVRHI